MIQVCYAVQDRSGKYSKHVGTSILSLLENTHEKITVHLIHDSTLTDDNRQKFIDIVSKYQQKIEFYNVDELIPNLIDEIKNELPNVKNFPWTIAAMYRLMLPKILPPDITKIIYLDADTIVNLDINELWQIDLENYPIAAMPHMSSFVDFEAVKTALRFDSTTIDPQDYFNSGVLIFDLTNFRKNLNC